MSSPIQHQESPNIQPFWQRLPRFFMYPLHMEPLLYMLFLSLASLLAFIPIPFFGLIVPIGIALAFIRYAYKILDQTAIGLLTPDQYEEYDDPDRASLPYKQFGIFVVIVFVIKLAHSAGGLFFGAALIYGMLSIPATIMILAITRSFWNALNPLAVWQVITAIGIPYLGLFAFISLLSASQGALQTILAPRIPMWVQFPVFNFVFMYFTLIMFNMMGYAIYQYHHLLGVKIKNPNNDAEEGSHAARKDESNSYAELIASGQIGKALNLAYEEKRANPEDVAANERYYKLLLLSDNDERLLAHARSYLALLLKKDLTVEAFELYGAIRERAPDFEPEEPAQLLRLARMARQKRDPALALSLIKGFDKRFPGNEEIPGVYFFAAQTLSEDLHKDTMARQILMALLKRYPSHPVSVEASKLLNSLDKLATLS